MRFSCYIHGSFIYIIYVHMYIFKICSRHLHTKGMERSALVSSSQTHPVELALHHGGRLPASRAQELKGKRRPASIHQKYMIFKHTHQRNGEKSPGKRQSDSPHRTSIAPRGERASVQGARTQRKEKAS